MKGRNENIDKKIHFGGVREFEHSRDSVQDDKTI